jgi:hypothetical protein
VSSSPCRCPEWSKELLVAASSVGRLMRAVAALPGVDVRVVDCGVVPMSFSSYRGGSGGGGLGPVVGGGVVRLAAAAMGSRRGWWGRVPKESVEEMNVGRRVAGLVGAGSKGEVEVGGECGGDGRVTKLVGAGSE